MSGMLTPLHREGDVVAMAVDTIRKLTNSLPARLALLAVVLGGLAMIALGGCFALRVHSVTSTSSLASAVPRCNTWETVFGPGASSELEYEGLTVQQVVAVSEKDVWLLGVSYHAQDGLQRLLFLHWDGNSVREYPPAHPEDGGVIYDAFALASNDVWAIATLSGGEKLSSVSYHWDGSSWETIPVPGEVLLTGVAASNTNEVWAVGSQGTTGRTAVMRWTGQDWKLAPNPDPADYSNKFDAVTAISPDSVWAIGSSRDASAEEDSSTRRAAILRWNGESWMMIDSPAGWTELSAISVNSDKTVWIVGADGQGRLLSAVRETDLANSSWRVIPISANPEYSRIYRLVARSPSDIWAVGIAWYDRAPDDGASHALVLHFDGQSWRREPFPTPLHTQSIFAADATPGGQLWVVGSYYPSADTAPGYPLAVYRTQCPSTEK